MIPGDVGRELAAVIAARVAAGRLPAAAAALSPDGTWRSAPRDAGGGPGVYSSSLPFALTRLTGRDPGQLGEELAGPLREIPWIAAARATGAGYLTVSVTSPHLAGLAQRIAAARWPGQPLDPPDLSGCRDWRQAWAVYRDVAAGRLAEAAGLPGRSRELASAARQKGGDGRKSGEDSVKAEGGPICGAIDYYGADAVRYALARSTTGIGTAIARDLNFPLNVLNPFMAVRYALADAASAGRWAADLELTPRPSPGVGSWPAPEPASGPALERASGPELEAELAELVVLDRLSWYPERMGAAARHRRPAILTGYLEALAGDWLDCRECCPALPFGGAAAPGDPAVRAWRLLLAAATRTVLADGLRLLSVAAPERT